MIPVMPGAGATQPREPGDLTHNYAELLSEGVGPSKGAVQNSVFAPTVSLILARYLLQSFDMLRTKHVVNSENLSGPHSRRVATTLAGMHTFWSTNGACLGK